MLTTLFLILQFFVLVFVYVVVRLSGVYADIAFSASVALLGVAAFLLVKEVKRRFD